MGAAAPITGRGVGYKMFVAKLIPDMSEMKKVYRLLKEAREQGIIPWGWIVDETRQLERVPSWKNPEEFAESAARQYRPDFWEQQPSRCEVWATAVNDVATIYDDARPLTALYVGDWDPSGLHMPEIDLPERLAKYGGDHVQVKRIALMQEQLAPLPSFPRRISAKTRATNGSSRTTAIVGICAAPRAVLGRGGPGHWWPITPRQPRQKSLNRVGLIQCT